MCSCFCCCSCFSAVELELSPNYATQRWTLSVVLRAQCRHRPSPRPRPDQTRVYSYSYCPVALWGPISIPIPIAALAGASKHYLKYYLCLTFAPQWLLNCLAFGCQFLHTHHTHTHCYALMCMCVFVYFSRYATGKTQAHMLPQIASRCISELGFLLLYYIHQDSRWQTLSTSVFQIKQTQACVKKSKKTRENFISKSLHSQF